MSTSAYCQSVARALLAAGCCLATIVVSSDSCEPSRITTSDNAGCGRWFPRFHPKNAKPLAHNNDAK